MSRYLPIIIIALLIRLNSFGQETIYSAGYQMLMLRNPGITGSEGDGFLRVSYLNLFPGNGYNLHSAFLSYDGFLPSLHGGAGFFISNSYLGGIVNDLKGGISYAYFFRAGKDLFFSSGLTASFYHRGYALGEAVLPDQIDPLGGIVLPPGEVLAGEGRTIFDMSTGFVFYSGSITGGLAVNHLAEPDLSLNDLDKGKLYRTVIVHLTGDFNISVKRSVRLQPLGVVEIQRNRFSASSGAVIAISHFSVSSLLIVDKYKDIDLQSGLAFDTGFISLFYSYRFNLFSGKNLLPFSLLHQTGVALRLYNVDKRKTVKTINFPKL